MATTAQNTPENRPAINSQNAITIDEVAKHFGKSASAVRKWASVGVERNGKRVKLATSRVGCSPMTSWEAVDAYMEATRNDL